MWRREVIGPPDCPLMNRWTLLWFGERFGQRLPKVLLHHFLPDRVDMDCHDHPRAFVTFVLRGGYDDLVPCEACEGRRAYTARVARMDLPCEVCGFAGFRGGERLRRGMVRFRRAEYRHLTAAGECGAWTLCVMLPVSRRWGFWREGRWLPFREYERRFGMAMRCGDEPVVRYGWDGTGAGNGG